MAYIYQIKNKVNNKIYIGSTINYKTRWYQHKHQLRNNIHSNEHLQNAWNKYGEDNFEFSILEEVQLEQQFIKEQEYLNKLNPFNDNGYNIERRTFKGAKSPHVISKTCCDCGKKFNIYRENAIRCQECAKDLSEDFRTGEAQKRYGERKSEEIEFNNMMIDIYGSLENYYDSIL